MLETLISSKTRVKLLLKFFLNKNNSSYLRSLENEFGDSTNAIRVELNRLENAGMLSSFMKGNKKFFQANQSHPLFNEVHSILLKNIGFDKIVETVVERLGEVEKVYVSGAFARGLDSQIIDLVFIGKINKGYLIELIDRAENLIRRKIRYVVFATVEEPKIEWDNLDFQPLLLWEKETF